MTSPLQRPERVRRARHRLGRAVVREGAVVDEPEHPVEVDVGHVKSLFSSPKTVFGLLDGAAAGAPPGAEPPARPAAPRLDAIASLVRVGELPA